MRIQSLVTTAVAAAALVTAGAASARAVNTIPYPQVGTLNPASYTFTAAASGDVMAYFVGGDASYDNQVGVLDNGVLTSAGYELDNKTSTIGESFDLGSVKAGDTLTFVLNNVSLGLHAYSNPLMNTPYDSETKIANTGPMLGGQHIYSTNYSASSNLFPGVPSGTYIGFEDKPYNSAFPFQSDHDYNDEQLVFTVKSVSAAPEPSTWMLMIAGVGLMGAALRRKPRLAGAVAA